MKPKFTILLILGLTTFSATAQNSEFQSKYQERLYHLGKVWGYTKYFNPNVAKCTANWDSALLQAVELVKKVESDEAFNQILVDMIDSAGEVIEASIPKEEVPKEFRYNLNVAWFEEEIFSNATKERLKRMEENFRRRPHCKLKEAFTGGNPTFESDKNFYESIGEYPNEPQRILGLFRYWNTINYFFPYKNIMDQDWDETLKQFTLPIVEAENALAYHLAFREMTTYINDSHAFFSSTPFARWLGFYLTPFTVKYVESQTVITGVHTSVQADLAIGDVVLEIDRQAINVVREKLRKYTAASNEPTMQRNINNSLRRGKEGTFALRVKNNDGEKILTLERKSYNDYQTLFENNGDSYKTMLAKGGCNVGYIDMDLLTTEEVPQMFAAFQNLPAIIIDIRNYPQGTLWEMVDYLYPSPVNFAAFTQPDIRYPGTLNYYQHSIGRGGIPYQGKLVILFNEETQSQAEFTVMGLEKHPDALKIGSQTAGADGNISNVYLPGNIRTVFTGLGVFYPDGTETQRIGMVPDIEFHPTVQGIREGRDEMLEFALDCDLLGLNIFEISTEDGINVFPNPTQSRLNIQSEFEESYTIELTDVLGRFVEGFTVNENAFGFSLDFSNYHNGIYMVYFRNKEGIFASRKIIKL